MQAVGNGVANIGLMKFRTPDAVLAEQAAKVAPPQTQPTISLLSGYINKCWQEAQQAKFPIEQQMLRNLRQDNGVYEGDTLAAIRHMGGSEIYVLLTATKCRAAEAWINDILKPVDDRPFAIQPTPISELTPDLQMGIENNTRAVFEEVLRQAMAANEQVNDLELREEIRKYAESERDKTLKKIQDEAKTRCERMTKKIDDQLIEGGWHDSFWGVVSDFVRLKAGIIKGPVIRRRKVQSWVQGENGWEIVAEYKLVPEYERVSPFDLYPAPDSRGVNDGYLIERHQLKRSDLIAMIGVPGYSEEDIRTVLQEYGLGGKREQLSIDSQRAMFDFGSTQSLYFSDKIDALEFWGSVPGRMLIDWGMKEDIDPDMDYEIDAWKVGNYVIRAILNPDKLGRKPYSVDSYQRVPGSFWGKGVPELMADVQDVCNSVARAIVNNSQLASGPMVEINSDRCKDFDELHPWRIFQANNQQMLEAPAIRFYQPQIITSQLLQVYDFFSTMSEDQTGIPRWAYGNSNLKGAGSTSSGLSMLMTSASRNVKEAISHLDRMISETISRTYDFNMLYDPDDSIKGDAKVFAKGTAGYLAKEQKAVRTNEILAATNNPTDLQIIGLNGRAKLLKQALTGLEIDSSDVIPDELDMKALIEKVEKQNAMLLQIQMQQKGSSPVGGSQPGSGMVPQSSPQTIDNAGMPAGGTDINAFQNAQGVTP